MSMAMSTWMGLPEYAAEGGGHRRAALGGGEAVRAGEDIARLDVPEKAFQLSGLRRSGSQGERQEDGYQQ
jgi:hypothetical protein